MRVDPWAKRIDECNTGSSLQRPLPPIVLRPTWNSTVFGKLIKKISHSFMVQVFTLLEVLGLPRLPSGDGEEDAS